ncbi:MAG: PKD domain-containing protein [Bacteroidetes bacterium]|nr:PKD domain-containing protein [Bacteroidota bacterium]
MKARLHILFLTLFLSLPFLAFSTHIVGGSITYIHNGGSSYTVTLKLYRDCGAGTAQFPDPVTISVVGNNGAPFSPSRDISIPLGTVTQVPSNLDTCATPPNPMPCTQEGIYTTTVNNLPPNPGGYHLYFQVVARNLSLTNVNASGNNVGESFYAYIPGTPVIWGEDFALPNGTTVDNGATAWTTSAGATPPATASVNNNLFQTTGANNGEQTWTSQVINIAAFTAGVNLRADLAENGTLDANDSIFVYYRLNGGPLTLFSTNGFIADDFANAVASQAGLIGGTIQIVIRVHFDANSPNSEIYRFDNVLVSGTAFTDNSNPAFTLFPPLFLCVGSPFTFDHSATDANGDSLAYSFYTPFNGDNGAGALDPTFPNNVATFQPVNFLGGFSATNPLGGTPLNLNVNTGLLSGTPAALGQYVVGILVKEYRNGVYISSTYRDFQFNVITCPTFAPAVLTPVASCNSNTISFSNLGGSSGANWLWNFGDPSTNTDVSTLNNPTYTYPVAGNYTITLTTGVGTSCANTATTTLVISRVTPNFSSTAPQCVGNTVTFTDLTTHSANASLTSWNWKFGDGGTSTAQNPTHVYLTGGTFNVTLIVGSNTNCIDTIVLPVVISAQPTANAGGNTTVCGNNPSVSLNGLVTNATGGIWTSSGSGTFSPNATTLNSFYLPSIADTAIGSVTLTLTTTGNGSCPAAVSTKVVTIANAPTVANAGPDQIVCGTTTASLVGNVPIVGTGLWTIVSGTATIANPTSPTTTISGLSPGNSVSLQWTISSPLCISTNDVVTINADLLPTTANAGNDLNLCMATTATLAANAPLVGTGQWSIVSGPGSITTPSSPTSAITGLIPNSTVVLRWTITRGVCISTDDVTLINSEIAVVNAGNNQALCAPANIQLNGSITGGTTTGIWTSLGTGSFSPSATSLNATYVLSNSDILNGNVTLVLTSTNNKPGCSAVTDTITINYAGFNGAVSITPTDVSCFGGSNGTATVSVIGGISPFTFFWNTVPAQSTPNAVNLTQGTYSVTITDGNGCTKLQTVVISQPAQLSMSGAVTNVSCFGGTNGSVVITPSGGTSPYNFLWQPGNQTTSSIINQSFGNYVVTVTDSKNCQQTLPFTITQPTALALGLTQTNVDCFGGSNGSVTSTLSGGTLPYVYNWNPSGASSPSISGVSAGTYTLTVTDNNGCIASSSATITEAAALAIPITVVNETCNNLNNGTAAVLASGGTPGYTFLWTPGNFNTSSISNLASGTYTLTVTDTKGCTAIGFATITEPATLTANFINQQNVNCFNAATGAVTVNAVGGTPNYSYFWVPGGFTTASLSNLQAGSYTVTLSDNNNCQTQNTVVITQPTQALSVTATSTPVSCNGGNNGTTSANPTGGTAPYTYLWTPGNSTAQNPIGLLKGTYSVTVTDFNGCSAVSTTTVSEPTALTLLGSSSNSNCGLANGIASVSVSGGSGPFSFQWSPTGGTNDTATGLISGSYTVLVIDGNGCSTSKIVNVNDNNGPSVSIIGITNVTCFGGTNGSASASVASGTGPFTFNWLPFGGNAAIATGLSAGIYTVVVTDANGCNSLATTSPSISQPAQLALNVTTTDVNCFGGTNGSASVIASGGTPGYSFVWSPVGGTNSSISNLAAANYSIQVTDSNNCVFSTNFSIDEPTQLSASVNSSSNVSCFGGNNGSATVSVNGGTPFYNYNWLPSGGNGPTGINLAAGNYTVEISDLHGCTNTATVFISQPSQPLTATATGVSTSCFGGSNGTATANPVGGTPGYTYQWLPLGGAGQTASGLSQGNYFVSITDANNCATNVALSVSQPLPVLVNLSPTNPSCGFPNGIVTSQVSGGTAPYAFLWTPTGSSNPTLNAAAPGPYTLQITDSKGCNASAQTTLTNIPGPTANLLFSTNVSCAGGSNGVASMQVSQGTLPYTINWSPFGGSNLVAQNLSAGSYTALVTDGLGCQATVNATISEPSPVTLSLQSSALVSCNGGSDGAATVAASGGTPSYTYSWSPILSNSASVSNLSFGTYVVTAFDQNFCTTSISVNIGQPTVLGSSIGAVINPSCFGGTGVASAIGVGGTFPYTYLWATNPPQVTSTATGLLAGSTSVTVTDSKGCSTVNTAVLTQPTQVITAGAPDISTCPGNAITLSATASGGGGNYFYSWQPNNVINNGSFVIALNTSTQFIVTAIDQGGCVGKADTINANIFLLPPGNVQVLGKTPICPGQSTLLHVQTSGTTGPLTYSWIGSTGGSISTNDSVLVTPTQAGMYYVTVNNPCSSPVFDSIFIDFNPPPTVLFASNNQSGCVPLSIQFIDNSLTGNSTDPISSWNWNFGDGTFSSQQNPGPHNYSSAGSYPVSLTVTTANGCTNNNASNPTVITAHPLPVAAFSMNSNNLDLPSDVLICNNQSVGAASYVWEFGDGGSSTLENPNYKYVLVGNFTVQLTAITEFGCVDVTTAEVTTNAQILFPNAFTPDGSSSSGGYYDANSLDNNIFFPYTAGVVGFRLQIFDRWGELIFESKDLSQGWDGYYRGKLCPSDVYIWKARMELNNGQILNKTGDVTLLR